MKIITECLQYITEIDAEIGIERKQVIKRYVESFDEQQLIHILSNNGILAKDININFYPNIGFRISNDPTFTGKLPICNFLQKKVNEKYNSYFVD
jgi:hypothetical protein